MSPVGWTTLHRSTGFLRVGSEVAGRFAWWKSASWISTLRFLSGVHFPTGHMPQVADQLPQLFITDHL
ncbi:hypothetical protein D9M68_911900 [compost metagenome]